MRLFDIAQKRDELEKRVLDPNHQTTERDVSEARELVSQYIDELERLEKTATPVPVPTDIEQVADEILKRRYPHD